MHTVVDITLSDVIEILESIKFKTKNAAIRIALDACTNYLVDMLFDKSTEENNVQFSENHEQYI